MSTASQQKETDSTTPRKVIVKTMTVNRSTDTVFEFFKNIKNMENGGILRISQKEKMAGGNFVLLQERQSLNLVEYGKN